MATTRGDSTWTRQLRADLRTMALSWANAQGLPYYESRGTPSTILFRRDGAIHGNFHPAVTEAIARETAWTSRLGKPHARRNALPFEEQADAAELDSSNSSDALLMNCFCYPGAAERIAHALGWRTTTELPEFGYRPGVALAGGRLDRSEVDMRLGSTFVEAKLTESSFTSCSADRVEAYVDFNACFDQAMLPTRGEDILGYQLVRNVLAAYQHDADLVVVVDQRRPDLLHEWWAVHAAIRPAQLRARCRFNTWQEVAAVSPPELQKLLAVKYGLLRT